MDDGDEDLLYQSNGGGLKVAAPGGEPAPDEPDFRDGQRNCVF